jgi:hypothetical protein
MLLVCGVSALVHLWSTDMLLYTAAVVAILLWTGDVLTCPVVVSPLTGKDPASMVVLAARQSYLGDLMRYLVALFGLLFFISDLRSAGFWLRDVEGALLLILPMFLLYPYLKSEEEMQQTCISDEELYAGEPVTLGRHILD